MDRHVLGDRYELLNRIGTGGMASVYHAHDALLGRDVAVKILHEQSAQDPSFVERFRREANAAAVLNHPNVVTIYDWGEAIRDGEPLYYMVMEYVPGQNLKEMLRERGALPEVEALEIAAQVALALEAAHQRGLVHRDVKPHNVLIDANGQAKVTDFGIAHATGLSQLTMTNAVSGTAHYLSPEQAQKKPMDGRSDVYSLGVVLYEMLTGEVPFDGGTLIDIALQHVNDRPPSPRKLRPNLSPTSEAIVLKALAKDPARRYASAAEMRLALHGAKAHLSRPRPQVKETEGPPPTFVQASNTMALPRARTAKLGSLPTSPRPRLRQQDDSGRAPWRMAVPILLLLLLIGSAAVFARTLIPDSGHKTHQASALKTSSPTASATHVKPTARIAATATPKPSATSTPRPAVVHPTTAPATAVPTHAAPARPAATSAPAQTAAPAATTQVAAVKKSAGNPAAAVESFYALVSQHQFNQAAQLWSSGMRQMYPTNENINQRFADTQSVSVVRAHVSSQSDGQATVDIDIVDKKASGSTEYVGTWTLVPDGNGGWLMSYPNLRQV